MGIKKLAGFAVLLLLCTCAITSCLVNVPSSSPSSESNAVFEEGTTVRLVRAQNSDIDITEIKELLFSLTGKIPSLIYDDEVAESHEIVIGDTARAVTAEAKSYMDGQLAGAVDTFAFCIYSKDSSVAIVWSNELMREQAIACFVNNYLNLSKLDPEDGVMYYKSEMINEAELESARRESDLDHIEETLGAEAREAMSAYLEIFDEDFYIWLAGLYDPDTGALYYSNSGRNTVGYLPDIESTARGWGWLSGSGMLENYNGDLKAALPEWLVQKLLDWIIPLQSSKDGYFYHPQWGGKEGVSRLGRDLDYATNFIAKLGGQQLYDGNNGTKGIYGAPSGVSSELTVPLGNNTAVAVSKVVATAVPSHLQSVDAFVEYMGDLNWDRSYNSGNTLESQATQIKNAGPEFIAAYEAFMKDRQEQIQQQLRDAGKEENGLWQADVSFYSVNGLMKICSTYTRLGIAIPYAEAAFESALKMVKLEGEDCNGKTSGAVVDVYNPWCAINYLISNTKTFGDPEVADRMRAKLAENAAELIKITARKNATFKKEDGSFGYNAVGGQPTSQSMPVALEGVDEGDVNGATIATNTIMAHMCQAFGVNKPQLYFNSDFDKFMDLIVNAGKIVKDPVPEVEYDPILGFEKEDEGETEPSGISSVMNTGTLSVIASPDGDEERGNVLEFITKSGANSYIRMTPSGDKETANKYVFEWDMNITENNKNTTVFQIRVGTAYMLTVDTRDDGYVFGDSSSESGTAIVRNSFASLGKCEYGEWYTFRIECYPAFEEGEAQITYLYVNGTKMAESTNYCGNRSDGTEKYNPSYEWARFFALGSSDMTVLFDNIFVENQVVEARSE